MPHVLFVCTANICRSPVAQAILRERLKEGWTVTSAGTWATEGRGAAENSRLVLAERGIDLDDHRSQMIDEEMVASADLVLCMETGHAEALRTEFSHYADKIFMLSEMVGKQFSIADPYGEPKEAYERMAREVEELIDEGLPLIIELAGENARKRWGLVD